MSAEHKDYICVTHGLRGYFPVLIKWYEDNEMYDICVSGETAKDFASCVEDAKAWAMAEGIEYR